MVGAEGSASGQWVGSAAVFDKRTKKTQSLDFEVVAVEPARLRLEATGAFGVAAASVVLNGDRLRILLPRQKRAIDARASESGLDQLIPLHLSPKVFLALLFDRKIDDENWRCESGAKAATSSDQSCESRDQDRGKSRGLKAKFTVRGVGSQTRKIALETREANVEMELREASSHVELNEATFQLDIPPDFRRENH